jgi:hypothetical protein
MIPLTPSPRPELSASSARAFSEVSKSLHHHGWFRPRRCCRSIRTQLWQLQYVNVAMIESEYVPGAGVVCAGTRP